MKKEFLILIVLVFVQYLYGQEESINAFDKNLINWYNKNIQEDQIMGASIDKVYKSLINNKEPKKTIVVAVIDGGVDINHKDLEGKIWVNEGEIPNNNIDDDNNGFIDDVNGWNFIGNNSGENINFENLEYTRIIKSGNKQDKDYNKALSLYENELKKRESQKNDIEKFSEMYNKAKKDIFDATGIQIKSKTDLHRVNSTNQQIINAKLFLEKKYSQGVDEEYIDDLMKRNSIYLDYYLNKDFNPREIVGDDPLNLKDKSYGNSDVIGPRADHGTTVAGVIAANRDNDYGINGIVENVKIMTLRTTPQGDERDKDVALSIIYAVNNGADIINMSFSKDLSPQKTFVDSAVRYAEEKGVLIIHGAGNKGENLDLNESYPSDKYLNGTEASNWLNVGAIQSSLDKGLPGVFSNYGKDHVDIFAPGVDVVSLDSSNTFIKTSGTSIAAPIVTGISALILSYYPELTPQELISVLLESVYKVTKPRKVLKPDLKIPKRKKIKFEELSKSGGIVDAYSAFKLLELREQTTAANPR